MTIRPGSPEAAILALIRRRGQVSAVEIGTACRMTHGDVRGRLVTLETMLLIPAATTSRTRRGASTRSRARACGRSSHDAAWPI